MSCGLEFPAGFLIGSNRRCSSVMETQLIVHHRSINKWNLSWFWERVWYEVHDLITDHGRFIYGSYEVLNVDIKNFVKELLRKRTLSIAKAIPWIPEPAFHKLYHFLFSVKSCWVLLYSGFVDPCCGWGSWAGLSWTVLLDYFSDRWW